MLPYIEQPTLDLGFYRLEAFPVLVGLAIVVEFQLVLRRAPARGIERATASALIVWAIVWGIVGAHVFELVAYQPRRLLADPLDLLRPWTGLSSFGGMLFGLAGLYWAMRRRRLSAPAMTRFADCVIFALPFCLAIGRAGCGLLHDHLGVSSSHWLAVAFPDGPRFDLGLLEFFYVGAVAVLFAVLDRWRWPDGFFIGLFFVLYGPVRFALDTLRVGEARYLGWTPAQYLSLLAAAAGLLVLVTALRHGGARPAEPS
jgi:phosphatidylglycerol:prolipoprotein diacylglycerol transferase